MLTRAPKQFVFICQKYWTNKQGQVCQTLLFFWETKFQCVSWADLWTSTLIHFKSFKVGTGKCSGLLGLRTNRITRGLQGQLNSTGTRLQLWLQSLTGLDRWDRAASGDWFSGWSNCLQQMVPGIGPIDFPYFQATPSPNQQLQLLCICICSYTCNHSPSFQLIFRFLVLQL